MEMLAGVDILNLFSDLQKFLVQAIDTYHSYVYLILFMILFCETGLVVTPFLPGDSLLFAAGMAAAGALRGATPGPPALDIAVLAPLLCLAPILGDSTNYWLGRFIGPKIFHKEKVRFLNKEHLNRAHAFYERHGGKAVAIGRFLPIIRTFVPFVAGIGKMYYPRFLAFSVAGTVAWINLCLFAGFFLGKRDFVKNNFERVIIVIVVVTLLPAIIGFIKTKLDIRKARSKDQAASTLKRD